MRSERKILIIEDDQGTYEVVSHHLRQEGFLIEWAKDGRSGLALALNTNFDLVILDLSLPALSGIEVCKELRRQKPTLPLIMLTARESEVDRVVGLEAGADDYMVKPFSIHELMARIRTRFRIAAHTSPASASPAVLEWGPIVLSSERREVNVSGAPLELTRTEFDVLEFFLKNPEKTISRLQLLEAVWGTNLSAYEDTVTTIVGRLRRKLEKATAVPGILRTVRGVGFLLTETAASDEE